MDEAIYALNAECDAMQDEIARIESENSKLRELVQDFYPFALGRAANPWLAVRRDRMRELGIEVKA